MFGIDASKFKLGNNTVIVRVDDINGNDLKLSNNSFSKAVLVTNFQQEKEMWMTQRKEMLTNLKTEKQNIINSFKQKFTQDRCTSVQAKVQDNLASFNSANEKHASAYANIIDKLNKSITSFDESKLNTTSIKNHLTELQVKIDKFKEDYIAYAAKLKELNTLTCGRSEGEFRGTLLEAKALLAFVHVDAVDIRSYSQDTMVIDLENLNAQLPAGINN
jgi:hypothetical protein